MSSDRFNEIKANLESVLDNIASISEAVGRKSDEVQLVVVTKTYPISDLEILFDLGIRDFGENRDQEARSKIDFLPSEVRWHFQGQIQSNKVNSITSWTNTIHSIDNHEHFRKIIDQLSSHPERPTEKLLIQINLDSPEHRAGRGGVPIDEIEGFLDHEVFSARIPDGVMAVAPLEGNTEDHFSRLVEMAHRLRRNGRVGVEISAGMSGDYREAISAGATLVRVGSSILGNRNYPI